MSLSLWDYFIGQDTTANQIAVDNSQAILNRQIAQGAVDPQTAKTLQATINELQDPIGPSETFLSVFPTVTAQDLYDVGNKAEDGFNNYFVTPINSTFSTWWDTAAFFPGEFAKTATADVAGVGSLVGETVSNAINPLIPSVAPVSDFLSQIKWIAIAGLGIYALVAFTPEIKRALK